MNYNKVKKHINLSIMEDPLLKINSLILLKSALNIENEKNLFNNENRINIQKTIIKRSFFVKKNIKNFIIGPGVINLFSNINEFNTYLTELKFSSICYLKYNCFILDFTSNREYWGFEKNKIIYCLFIFFKGSTLLASPFLI